MTPDTPFAKPTLLSALYDTEREVTEFFGSLAPDDYTFRQESAWTPAEHLEHLRISVAAVTRGFSAPRWLLRVRFGRARRRSRTFEELRGDYRARLGAGGGASGQFVPTREEPTGAQRGVPQAERIARWRRVNERFRAALDGWSERDLDRIQLPHPLLGMLTAREMVLFTVYHAGHHVAAAKRRLPGHTLG